MTPVVSVEAADRNGFRCDAIFVVGRDRAKLGWFWRHVRISAQSGRFLVSIVNPDEGGPVFVGEDRLLASDFRFYIPYGSSAVHAASNETIASMVESETKDEIASSPESVYTSTLSRMRL